MIFIIIFLLGSVLGSFIKLIIDRSNNNKSIIFGRSHCDSCNKPIKKLDLIPVISYIALKGKCRNCHKVLSINYLAIEFLTGFLFVISALTVMPDYQLNNIVLVDLVSILLLFIISSVLVVIFFTDLEYGIIPLWSVLLGIAATLLIILYTPLLNHSIINYILSGLGAFVFLLMIFLITHGRGMGFGDVIYALLMGLLLGYPLIILGLYIAFILGAIVSLLLVIMKKKKLKGDSIPFGPFLVFGTWVSLFWGNQLLSLIMPHLLS